MLITRISGLQKKIADEVISLFEEEIVDRVSLVYTHFYSVISQVAKVIPLLPLSKLKDFKDLPEKKRHSAYIYEPSPDEVFDILLPKYISNILYSAVLEAKASE